MVVQPSFLKACKAIDPGAEYLTQAAGHPQLTGMRQLKDRKQILE